MVHGGQVESFDEDAGRPSCLFGGVLTADTVELLSRIRNF